jgi:hypothetical protein
MKTVPPMKLTPVRVEADGPTDPLPLVVFPRRGSPPEQDWARSVQACAARYLPRVGSMLFRGFPVRGPAELARLSGASSISATGVGSILGGADGGRLWIGCTGVPVANGCTLIAEHREVYAELSGRLRARLIQRGLRHVRSFRDDGPTGWQGYFQTTERDPVERWCRARDTAFHWLPDGGLRLERAAAPVTRQPCGNQARKADWGLLWQHAWRTASARAGQEAHGGRASWDVLYADGSALEPEASAEIAAAFTAVAGRLDWERGDVLVVDRDVSCALIPQSERDALHFATDAIAAPRPS